MEVNEYFTKENLKEFLAWLRDKEPYVKYDDPRLRSGLELYKSYIDNDGKLLVGEEENNELVIKQGKYYYDNSSDGISGIKFGKFKTVDNTVMGESAIQFKTKNTQDIIKSEGGDDWNWITNIGTNSSDYVPVFKPDSTYLIHLTSDHKKVFAEVNHCETINMSDIVVGDSKVFIEITYETSSNSVSVISSEWLKKSNIINIVSDILFAADGSNYSSVELSALKNTNKLSCSSNNPKLLIQFTEEDICNIDLSYLLNNISFKTFKIQMPARRISSMRYMFAGGSAISSFYKTCYSIDLTGITNPDDFFLRGGNPDDMYVGMFMNRKLQADNDGTKLKLFGRIDGAKRGIDTSKATNLSYMFCNGPLKNVHCCPDENQTSSIKGSDTNYEHGVPNILRCLSFDSCINFKSMFSGCDISKINFFYILKNFNWDNRLNNHSKSNELNCDFSGMFQSTNIENIDGISNFIYKVFKVPMTNGEKLKRVTSINLSYLFDSCNNINDASKFFNINSIGDFFRFESGLETINMSGMFSNCPNLSNTPTLILRHYSYDYNTKDEYNPKLKDIDMSGMFQNSGNSLSDDKFNFRSFENWELSFDTELSIEGEDAKYNSVLNELKMNNMFNNCPLWKLGKQNRSFIFCNAGDIDKPCKSKLIPFNGSAGNITSAMQCTGMFQNTVSNNTSYNLTFNIWTGDIDVYDDNQESINGIGETGIKFDTFEDYQDMLDTNNSGIYSIIYDEHGKETGNASVRQSILQYGLISKIYYSNRGFCKRIVQHANGLAK